ncbi:hypothetical protein [Siphonobacter sp.]|uniref:hypothetical protein n=1 Tax=Siphonobacter sp. TaxID=1869184 RepID=UPI003B3B944F
MYKLFTPIFFLISVLSVSAQMGIGTSTPHPGAALDIVSPDKALLIPRVTEVNRPGSPGKEAATPGMIVYQPDGIPGFYLYNWDGWIKVMTPMDVKPQGFAYAVSYFTTDYVLNVEPIFPTQISLRVPYSNGDIYSQEPHSITINKSGVYSIEYDMTPISVTGNQYQLLLNVANNTGSSNGVVPGSVQISSQGDPKVHGHVMLYVSQGARVSLIALPYPNTSTSSLTFGSADYQHGVSMKIVRQL